VSRNNYVRWYKETNRFMQQTPVKVCIQILQRNENKGSLRIYISQSKSIHFQRMRRMTHRVRAHPYGLWLCILFSALYQRFSNCGPRTTSGPRVLPLWSS
jgi:hypothetical protein